METLHWESVSIQMDFDMPVANLAKQVKNYSVETSVKMGKAYKAYLDMSFMVTSFHLWAVQ